MKIKMPQLPKFPKRKKLRAATVRRSFGASTGVDYEEMSEPNMKLSRALLIVLVLHIVAVAGIIAFNAIKTRQASVMPAPLPPATTESSTADSTTKPAAVAAKTVPAQKTIAPRDETKPSHSPAKALAKDEHKSEHAKSSEKASTSTDSAKTYLVVKGDNPVTIAKKLKVSYDELIALNHIDDPRKLQIGQKLLIPKKISKAKKTSE
jgi:nucleoid-associated protein YgaU